MTHGMCGDVVLVKDARGGVERVVGADDADVAEARVQSGVVAGPEQRRR
jgi:hypothetical protein